MSENTSNGAETPVKGSLFKNNFVTGLFIVIPVLVTLWIGCWAVTFLTDWAVNILRDSGITQPGYTIGVRVAALILIMAAVFFVGLLARITFGKKIINLFQQILLKIPILKIVYSTCEQIGETVKKQRGGLFKKAVLFEYPLKGTYAIGFLTSYNEDKNELTDKLGGQFYSVFMPTTPNPTSGFLMLVPKENCVILDMDPSDAMKLIVSCGVMFPGQQEGEEK